MKLKISPRDHHYIFLLNDIGMVDFSGWAIALNEEVIPHGDINGKTLVEGDRLILVQATQGG